MCYRLKRAARITWMEASELLQNRNKCSREGGRGVPRCRLLLSVPRKPHSCFLRPGRWRDVTDESMSCEWMTDGWWHQSYIGVHLIEDVRLCCLCLAPLRHCSGAGAPFAPLQLLGPWRTQGALVSLYVTVPTARTDSFTSTLRTDGSGAVSGQSGSSW